MFLFKKSIVKLDLKTLQNSNFHTDFVTKILSNFQKCLKTLKLCIFGWQWDQTKICPRKKKNRRRPIKPDGGCSAQTSTPNPNKCDESGAVKDEWRWCVFFSLLQKFSSFCSFGCFTVKFQLKENCGVTAAKKQNTSLSAAAGMTGRSARCDDWDLKRNKKIYKK